jgi:hypothetical protein
VVETGKGSEVVCAKGFMMKDPMRAVNLKKGRYCDNCLQRSVRRIVSAMVTTGQACERGMRRGVVMRVREAVANT